MIEALEQKSDYLLHQKTYIFEPFHYHTRSLCFQSKQSAQLSKQENLEIQTCKIELH